VITVGILRRQILSFEGFVTDLMLNTDSVPSKLRIYLCKIPTVITETFDCVNQILHYQLSRNLKFTEDELNAMYRALG
jgi:hypothetical protein